MALASGEMAGTHVMPGDIVRLPCVARLTEPGLYYVAFTVFASEAAQVRLLKDISTEPVEWSSATLVTVE
jgi:hypothetical protein